MTIRRILSAAAIALLALAPSAEAKGPKGCPPGLAKKSPACIPPGLAKKNSYRAPERYDPYVHRADRDDLRREDRIRSDRYGWRRGDRIPRDRYVILAEGDRVIFNGREYTVVDTDRATVLRRDDDWYRLPDYYDEDYVILDNRIVRVDPTTRRILDIIELADLLLN